MIPPSILLSPLTSVLFAAANVTGCTPYSHRYIISRGGFTDSSSIHCWVFFWWRVHPIAALLWILCLDSLFGFFFGFFVWILCLNSLTLTHYLPTLAASLLHSSFITVITPGFFVWRTAPFPCHLFSHHISVTLTVSLKSHVWTAAQTNPRPWMTCCGADSIFSLVPITFSAHVH